MDIRLISWLTFVLSMIGSYGVSHKKIWGLVVWCFSNLFLIIISIVSKNLPLLLMYVCFTGMNFYSIYQWKKDKNEHWK